MHLRDKVFTLVGLLVGLSGIIATTFWSVEAGVVALLALGLLILALVLLQRRQIAKIQQRMLSILYLQQAANSVSKETRLNASHIKSLQDLPVYTTKVIGLLQAQQISMEVLNKKVERVIERNTNKHSSF